MIELAGISLTDRQKELTAKICDAVRKKANFDEIKSLPEKSDVDKLYKIGVASKYKNVEYIIEMLKSGDSLYISKVLKCIWLYGNEYTQIINPEYLHENIFPFMSLKMMKKFLIRISMYMKDARAINFYIYCSTIKHENIAMKFLVFTPETFKLETLKDENVLCKLRASNKFLKLFLGNSCVLAEAYYNTASEYDQANALYQLRYFFYVSDVKYLELLRKSTCHWSRFKRMGLRISKDILVKHKDEVYKKPMMYLYLLNKNILVQYSTVDDAKFYMKTLISNDCPKLTDFWNKNFCDTYDYIIDKIPSDQRMQFIKNNFTDQYPHKEFETSKKFYYSKLYKLMTTEEREQWALRHLQSNVKLLGAGRDFLWYRFVSFNKAFSAVKEYIQKVVNNDVRTEVLSVLVESAKTDTDLEILFDYYYIQHIDEPQQHKERFVDAILLEHNVYEFGESCWIAFNKILFSLKVYDTLDCVHCKSDYKNLALIYHIIHEKELPEALTKFIDSGINLCAFKTQTKKLTNEKVINVYQYLLQFYLDKIKLFDYTAYDNEVKCGVRKYIHFVLDLMYQYKNSKEVIPEIINKYIHLDFDEFRNHPLLKEIDSKLTQQRLICYLKNNKELVISNLLLIKNKISKCNSFKLNKLLKLLRIYFSNDLATIFLKLFMEILVEQNTNPNAIKRSVYGVFQLADMDFKTDFMTKYAPEEDKIDHTKVDRKVLRIQKAICNMVCYSRPPVPLSEITKYIKGDYVHFCLPMFNSYLTELPKPVCVEFVKSLLDRPLSVQKHGLRMAFECFSVEDMRKVILEVWNNTTNVSLRSSIYTYIYNKILDVDEQKQNELFEGLKTITRSVNHEDDEEVFRLVTTYNLPERFLSDYMEIAWNVIDSFPKTNWFVYLREKIINCIVSNIYLIRKDVAESIIYDHIKIMLKEEQIRRKYENYEEEYLVRSKWNLLHKYVTFFTDEDDFHKKSELVMVAIKEYIRIWDKVADNKYISKQYVSYFIIDLNRSSYSHDFKHYAKTNVIFEQILKELQDNLPPEEIYELFWNIRICIITRDVICDGKKNLDQKVDDNFPIVQCLNTFARKFANLLIDSIENRQYFMSLSDVIIDKLQIHLREIFMYLNYEYNNIDPGTDNAVVLVCLEILEYVKSETYMFVAKALPWDIHNYIDREVYMKVIRKLRSCEFTEVKYFMYKKFVNFDYTFRDFMLSDFNTTFV